MSSSRKRGRKPQQQRLTFEAAVGSPTANGSSPATVRLSSPGGNSSSSPSRSLPVRTSPAAKMGTRGRGKRKGPRQQTLEASLGQERTKRTSRKQTVTEGDDDDDDDDKLTASSTGKDVEPRRKAVPTPPRSSFMKIKKGGRRVPVQDSDSETPVEEDGAVSDSSGEGPLKQETPRQTRARQAVSMPSDSEDEESDKEQANKVQSQSLPNQSAADADSDDVPLNTPRSSMPRRKGRPVITLDDEDEDIQTPAKRRRITKSRAAPVQSESSSEKSDTIPVRSKGKLISKKRGSSPPASSSRSMRSTAQKSHRSDKEKRMELLRRRRAGEKDLKLEDLTSSSEDEDAALYDTDEEHQALEVFDDESEPEEEVAAKKQSKKKKKAAKKHRPARQSRAPDDNDNSEDEDFIDDDDDTLGVPDEALHLIPLEFTMASRKPLKDHFKDAVEWLVHRKINPSFERDNEVYVTAWRRLSDEVTGLANSKFISSVWRPDFYKALKARPYIEQMELGPGNLAVETENCQACGRSGHPATWSIQFMGKPYDPKTLDEVESDSEDEDEDEEGFDRDYDGTLIPPEDKQFFVGQTCNSNAETAHSLMHWRPSLRDWVDARLEGEGYMTPERIVEREQMKARRRERLANDIVEGWAESDIIKNLFLDFKKTIESARTKDTTKMSRGARRF